MLFHKIVFSDRKNVWSGKGKNIYDEIIMEKPKLKAVWARV